MMVMATKNTMMMMMVMVVHMTKTITDMTEREN